MRVAIPLMIAGVAVAACATQYAPFQRTPQAASHLAAALNGRVAGPPQDCLPSFASASSEVIDDHTVLYRVGATTYAMDPPGGCAGLGEFGNTMVIKPIGSQLCRGDIARVIDTSTNSSRGSCTIGSFTPFRVPR